MNKKNHMTDETQKTKELLKCISELDIDGTTKQSVLDSVRRGQLSKGLLILKQYRGAILRDLHDDQDKLYQIDFVLQKAK